MNRFKYFFSYYQNHHIHDTRLLKHMGVIGVIGYPLFYLLYTQLIIQPYENFTIRAIATVLCLLLALKDRWPEKLKPYYIAYSYGVLLYCLPFFHVFMSLKNQGGVVMIADSFMAVFFMVLLVDWRNMIVMFVSGNALASLLYIATTPSPHIPLDYVARLPTFILIMIGGCLFKYSRKQIEAEKIRAVKALAGSIAHEMRNPLGQAKFSLESLANRLPIPKPTVNMSNTQQEISTETLSELYEHLAQGQLAITRGLQVITMILEEVKDNSIDKSQFSYLSASHVVQKAIDEYGYETTDARKKISLHVIEDFTFKGDETSCIFILFNLIKNALFYFKTHPNALITISVCKGSIKVRDTGPGIAPDVLQNLFESFKTANKLGGTGLGLSYCKRIMHAFGGSISCQSTVNEYTEFTLTFPELAPEALNQVQQAQLDQLKTALREKRILVVDDDASIRTVTQKMLTSIGIEVELAENGAIALNKLQQSRYDLILLDLNMPVLDGYSLAEQIRAGTVHMIATYKNIPIIAHTTESAYLTKIKTQKVGMNAFINKPCSQLELLQTIKTCLEHQTYLQVEEASLSGKTILVADDSKVNRFILKIYLEEQGITVIEAENGQVLLDQLSETHCDAVITDLQMPIMNGLEAIKTIRQTKNTFTQIPIIVVSGDSHSDLIQACYAAGINDFLVKPISKNILYEKLTRLLTTSTNELFIKSQKLAQNTPSLYTEKTAALINGQRVQELKKMGVWQEVVSYFLEETTMVLDHAARSLQQKNLPELHQALHALKGSANNLGATALLNSVSYFYQLTERNTWPQEPDWLEKIKDTYLQTTAWLRNQSV